ncbi:MULTISPECIES: uberolysin/carnocyclin family circular bacteriocin [Bacillus cereus group]|uniref:Uberolysin/carnocyclin family circular bacteriocin n=1 Tax=Bacillus thuringiensis TaxID=1428 RepID=A0AAW9JPP3_BACTU|nr:MULTISPECIES: uberolysin/carnocyclin family circular bacteriocin [Bacillus cereus group]MDZ5480650.1 uberolysin/carnocyclin family circular bacteriocin [Bacillus thuringiensis]PEF37378.1 circularin A/uberolysin family circular bacteriocin [Bacillus wiedmannii]
MKIKKVLAGTLGLGVVGSVLALDQFSGGGLANLTLQYDISAVNAGRIVTAIEWASDMSAVISLAGAILGAGIGAAAISAAIAIAKKKLLKEGKKAAVLY